MTVTWTGPNVTATAEFIADRDGIVRLVELTFTANPGETISAADLRRYPLSTQRGEASAALWRPRGRRIR